MCKLFGWTTERKLNYEKRKKVKKLIESLLIVGGVVLNNPHGTGVMIRTGNGESTLIKRKYNALEFLIRDREILDYWFLRDVRTVIGHVRFATSGTISSKNAHPYRFGTFYGAHNGILEMNVLKKLAKEEGVRVKQSDNDTRIFFKLMAKMIEQGQLTLKESLKYFLDKNNIGDYTFLFYFQEKLWFIRSGRPLTGYQTDLGWFLTSTEEMFNKSVELAGINLKKKKKQIEENVLYVIEEEEIREVCEIKPPRPPQPVYQPNYYGSYRSSYGGYNNYNWDWDRTDTRYSTSTGYSTSTFADYSYLEEGTPLEELALAEEGLIDLSPIEMLKLVEEAIDYLTEDIEQIEATMIANDLVDDEYLQAEIAEKKELLKRLKRKYKIVEKEVKRDMNKKLYQEFTRSI